MLYTVLIDETYQSVLLENIRRAQSSIYATVYYVSYREKKYNDIISQVMRTLIEQANRGVQVKLLVHKGNVPRVMFNQNRKLKDIMKNTGVQVRYWNSSRILHAKLFLFDRSVAMLGSHNLSNTSMRQSVELSVVLSDNIEIAKLNKKYDEWWSKGV